MTVVSTPTDREIHRRVIEELKWDPRVDETEVGVEVDSGVVTLTGTVTSYAKKLEAQNAAHQVFGVLDVANDIQVKLPGGPKRTDTEIAQAARMALKWDVLVPHEKIQTTVANGWVTLTGTIPTWNDRREAERVVERLDGVLGITNSLIVTQPPAETETVKREIEAALERRAEREARRITITMRDGTASLEGRVHNWHEKQAVLGAAFGTRGVQAVEDHLQVDPYF